MRSPAESKIAKAIENGEFDNLRGKGKPLTLEDLARDENLAHRLLVDSGFSLPWIELKREIDADSETAIQRLSQRAAWLRSQGELLKSSSRWAEAAKDFRSETRMLNQRIDEYNLRVPLAQFQRRRIDPDAEIEGVVSD